MILKRKAAACLAAVLLLSLMGCGQAAPPPSSGDAGEDHPQGTRVAASHEYAAISLTVPEGWAYETEEGGADPPCAIRFWPEDAPECSVTLAAYEEAVGLCGTGVTIEERNWDSGQQATAYSETFSGEDTCWYFLVYQDTPGFYAAEYMDSAAWWDTWGAQAEEILSTAQLGGDAVRKSEAIAAAREASGAQQEKVCADFDMTSGIWSVSFYIGDSRLKVHQAVTLNSRGEIMEP